MKAIGCLVALCLLAGYISAEQYIWETGKIYRYQTHGRLFAGISEIDSQYAGLDLKYNVHIIPIGPNRIYMRFTGFQISEVNDEQNGGWRDVHELQNETPVQLDDKMRTMLESAVVAKYNKGGIESIMVDGSLPNYAINIKKGQISPWVINPTGQDATMVGNLNRPTLNQVRPDDHSSRSGIFYEVMEETVLGECQTYYTITESEAYNSPRTDAIQNELYADRKDQQDQEQDDQNTQEDQDDNNSSEGTQYYNMHSKYMYYRDLAKDNSASGSSEEYGVLAPEIFHQLCDGKPKLIEITKAVNYSMCKTKPVLGYASPSFILNSRAGDNTLGSMLGRVAFSRYIACGKDRKQMRILKVAQEEHINTGLLRKEKIVGGTVQNITLISVFPSKEVPKPLQNPKEIKDLTYTFSAREQKLRRHGKVYSAYNNAEDDESSSEEATTGAYYQPQNQYSNYRSRRDAQYYSENDEDSYEAQGDEAEKAQYGMQWPKSDNKLRMPSLTQPPINPMFVSPLDVEGMKKRVGVLLDEIVEDLTNKEPVAEAETISKVETVATILRYLGYADLEILYNQHADKEQTDEDRIRRSMYLDAVAMAGTNPNWKLLIDLMTKRKIHGEKATQLVMTFPHYMRTPTQELLHYFFEKLVSFTPRPEDQDQFHTTSVLAFSNALYDACVNSRIASTRFPIQLYGKFCDAAVVENKYLPYFIKQLRWALEEVKRDKGQSVASMHWQTVFFAALGNTGHPAIVKEVQRVLDLEEDSYIKTKAVFALKRLLTSRSSENVPLSEVIGEDRKNRDILTDEVVEKNVLPILLSVAFDKTEDQEVRMAAIVLMVAATSFDMTHWQQLAYSTWFELNQEVHSYIFSLIRSLSSLSPLNRHTSIVHKRALAVLPLVKPINIGITRSRVWHEAQMFEELQSGYVHHLSHFGSENSVYPNSIYYQNYKSYGNGALGEVPISVAIHGRTIHDIVASVIAKLMRPKKSDIEGNDYIKKIADLLKIVDREQDETPEASIQIKLKNEMERIFSINQHSIDEFVEYLKRAYFPQLLTGIPINYQKSMKLSDITHEYPTIFGIPVSVLRRSHNLVSLRGSMKVFAKPGLETLQVNAELHPIVSYKFHSRVMFKSPFTGKGYKAGVRHHVALEFPFRALFTKTAAGDLHFGVTPTHLSEGQVSGSIDVVNFHRIPYTMIVQDCFWPTSHKEGGQPKPVRSDDPWKSVNKFGDSIGLSLTLEQETDFLPEQEQFPGWVRFFRRFSGSYGSWAHKGIFGAKTLRFVERKLTLDVSESKTKSFILVLADKFKNEAPQVIVPASGQNDDLINADSDSSEETITPATGNYRNNYNERSSYYYPNNFESSQERRKHNHKTRVHHYKSNDYQRQQYEQYQKHQDSSEESYEDFEGEFQYAQNPKKYFDAYEYQQYQSNAGGESDVLNRRWFVVGLLGKMSPLRPPLSLHEPQDDYINAPSSNYFLISVDLTPENVKVWVSGGSSVKDHIRNIPYNSAALEDIRQAIIKPTLSNTQTPFCGSYIGQYKFPDFVSRNNLLVLRQRLLSQDLKVELEGELTFGPTCTNVKSNISIKGQLWRNQDLHEWAKTDSFEAKKCTEDEKKGFHSSPVCIVNSEQQAAGLNEATFDITSSGLPLSWKNATLQVREFVKAYLYEYMSYNPSLTGPLTTPNFLKIHTKLTPQSDFVTLKFDSRDETVFFHDVKMSPLARAVLPLTATQTLPENVRDRVFKSQASCSLQESFLNTFDNVTYNFDSTVAKKCSHVLVQDCSGQKSVSVSVRNVGTKAIQTNILLPGNFRIELNPIQGSCPRQNSYQGDYVRAVDDKKTIEGRVIVNNKPITSLPVDLKDSEGNFVARIEEGGRNGHCAAIQVISEDVQVTTDAWNVVVYPSNELRNSSCGMCGNFDVSKSKDLRSPKDCPLSTGTLMYGAYAFERPWKTITVVECEVSAEVRKAIANEERDCERGEFIPVYLSGSCQEQLVQKIGNAVYNIVKSALKVIPFVNSEKWATKSRDAVATILTGKVNVNEIADSVATGISKIVPHIGPAIKPLIKSAITPIIKIVCEKSGCCDNYYYF